MNFSTMTRPDPDALLSKVQSEDARAQRGRLRIYFGSSAGVGKTFAMLSAAQKLAAEGASPVLGVIETHGRRETMALIGHLETIPPKQIEYRGRLLAEFDLDAALARHPDLLLVDELAHSNVEGSRHPKRWQDVEELLNAGIDVWTTLNVQHLESLNDVVGGITGIRILETLPDRVFNEADEVILVDLPADELLARLQAGKVYLPQQAERAVQNFFRKGNLIALREIALRRTADRVEDEVKTYRVEKSISTVWKTQNGVLACVGPGAEAEHVVRSAARLARQFNVTWHAVYVETPALQRYAQTQRDQTLAVLKLAEQLQARTAVLTGDDPARLIIDYAEQHNLVQLIVGQSAPSAWSVWPFKWFTKICRRSFRDALHVFGKALDITIVAQPKEMISRPLVAPKVSMLHADAVRDEHKQAWLPYVWSALSCVLPTLLATALLPLFDLANIVMLFLLGVVGVAVRWGRGPAVLSAFLSVAVFDFFFVPPRFSFAVSDVQYLLTFVVMLVVALVIGQLTAGLRYQVSIASQRETRARILFEFARDLSSALQTEQVLEISTAALERFFSGQVHILLPDLSERLQIPTVSGPPALDVAIAQWAFDHELSAGFGTDTLPASPYLYLPLSAPVRLRGVLAICPGKHRWLLIPEQKRQLETFANLIAIALERVHFVDVAREMLVRIESERLRNSLLAAISHDLRTPLTALVGLADALSMNQTQVNQTLNSASASEQAFELALHGQIELTASIRDAALRMNVLVNNLLDMARLESGEVTPRKTWESIEEVVGSSIRSIKPLLGEHDITTSIPADLPLVEFDPILLERVLVNLLENAAKYSKGHTPIEIRAALVGKELVVSVLDRGIGLPSGAEKQIFEKFQRGETESAIPGVGLGLAICRSIIEAHHGKITASHRLGGGAELIFTLPLGEPPTLQDDSTDLNDRRE